VCSLARAFRSFGILQKGQPGKVLGAVHSTTPCSTYFLLPDSPPGLRLELNQPNPMRYIHSDVHLISRNTWVSLPRLALPHLGQDTSSHLEPQLPNTHPPASASLTAKVPTEMFLPFAKDVTYRGICGKQDGGHGKWGCFSALEGSGKRVSLCVRTYTHTYVSIQTNQNIYAR
jgi:hypothetical protein